MYIYKHKTTLICMCAYEPILCIYVCIHACINPKMSTRKWQENDRETTGKREKVAKTKKIFVQIPFFCTKKVPKQIPFLVQIHVNQIFAVFIDMNIHACMHAYIHTGVEMNDSNNLGFRAIHVYIWSYMHKYIHTCMHTYRSRNKRQQ